MIRGLLRRDAVGAWDDAPGDDLPARIDRLVAGDVPDVAASVERRRAIVMAAFRATAQSPATRPARGAGALPARRRWAFAFATAMLTLVVGVAGVAASSAGGPLYPLRLATEEVFLPAGGEERLSAQLGRLERRIGEAEEASASGNRAGLDAALAAYREIVATVEAGAPEQLALTVEARLRLQDRIRAQVGRLESISGVDLGQLAVTIDAGRRLGERVGGQQGPGPGEPGGPDGPGGPGDPPGVQGPGSGGLPVAPPPTPTASPSGEGPGPSAGTGGDGPSASANPACAGSPACRGGRPEPGTGLR